MRMAADRGSCVAPAGVGFKTGSWWRTPARLLPQLAPVLPLLGLLADSGTNGAVSVRRRRPRLRYSSPRAVSAVEATMQQLPE